MNLFGSKPAKQASVNLPQRERQPVSRKPRRKTAAGKTRAQAVRHSSVATDVQPLGGSRSVRPAMRKKAQRQEGSIFDHNLVRLLPVLIIVVALLAVNVWSKYSTRAARFELTRLKQAQLALIQEKEGLQNEISVEKSKETISRKAGGQGLRIPNREQTIRLP